MTTADRGAIFENHRRAGIQGVQQPKIQADLPKVGLRPRVKEQSAEGGFVAPSVGEERVWQHCRVEAPPNRGETSEP